MDLLVPSGLASDVVVPCSGDALNTATVEGIAAGTSMLQGLVTPSADECVDMIALSIGLISFEPVSEGIAPHCTSDLRTSEEDGNATLSGIAIKVVVARGALVVLIGICATELTRTDPWS
jgi:hypothetical protein